MSIVPLGDRVLIRPVAADAKTKGGIILTNPEQEDYVTGLVLAVGAGEVIPGTSELRPLSLKVGDKVLYHRHSGIKIMGEDQEELLIIKESELLATIQ